MMTSRMVVQSGLGLGLGLVLGAHLKQRQMPDRLWPTDFLSEVRLRVRLMVKVVVRVRLRDRVTGMRCLLMIFD